MTINYIVSLPNPGEPGVPKELFSSDPALIERFVKPKIGQAAVSTIASIHWSQDQAPQPGNRGGTAVYLF